jgi:hypothetical protein
LAVGNSYSGSNLVVRMAHLAIREHLPLPLEDSDGETLVRPGERPSWTWPTR